MNSSPININKPPEVRAYITACMDEMEAMVLEQSTKKSVLKEVSKDCFAEDEQGCECTKCEGAGTFRDGPCLRCGGKGIIDASAKPVYDNTGGIKVGNHPAAWRARELLDIKAAAKEKRTAPATGEGQEGSCC